MIIVRIVLFQVSSKLIEEHPSFRGFDTVDKLSGTECSTGGDNESGSWMVGSRWCTNIEFVPRFT